MGELARHASSLAERRQTRRHDCSLELLIGCPQRCRGLPYRAEGLVWRDVGQSFGADPETTSWAAFRLRIGIVRQVMVADLSHHLDLPEDTPAPARRMAAQLSDIACAATSGDPGPAWESALPCRRRPAHRTCPGRTVVHRSPLGGPIRWQCGRCDDAGSISSWEDSPFDVRR